MEVGANYACLVKQKNIHIFINTTDTQLTAAGFVRVFILRNNIPHVTNFEVLRNAVFYILRGPRLNAGTPSNSARHT
jgi:hypothetical protein